MTRCKLVWTLNDGRTFYQDWTNATVENNNGRDFLGWVKDSKNNRVEQKLMEPDGTETTVNLGELKSVNLVFED